jgi:hypothetical protein
VLDRVPVFVACLSDVCWEQEDRRIVW